MEESISLTVYLKEGKSSHLQEDPVLFGHRTALWEDKDQYIFLA
jgi:hypothetical protein